MREDEKDNVKFISLPFLGHLEPILCPFLDPLPNYLKKWHVTPSLKDIFKTIMMMKEDE